MVPPIGTISADLLEVIADVQYVMLTLIQETVSSVVLVVPLAICTVSPLRGMCPGHGKVLHCCQ